MSAFDRDRRGYYYKVRFEAGETFFVSFRYPAYFDNPVWQITPGDGAEIEVHGTVALEPEDADWIEHHTYPTIKEAVADNENLAVRHLRFTVTGAGGVFHLTTLQSVSIGSSPADLSLQR